ncbi:MAG: alpha/beta fold hydrolase [Gammaproteobacteria bacterium]|nr:alpha/beta fold hydrolase [Gammaproteobacteria bacterium]
MPRIKASFENQEGETLAGLLEAPDGEVKAYALFAHCFTCSKDIAAASRITRGLAKKGVAVLRFDFTGLGNSDGDFANTNFSSNLQDLIQAANWLENNYAAPSMIIGHSLGGAAVLAAAQSIDSIKAVVTIAAPATGHHVEHLFSKAKDEILDKEQATVDLAGRQFTIKKQFLEDINRYNDIEHIGKLGKALLVFHSPVDETVAIDEAAKIYTAAKHPKSFISLDNADHLLSRREDSEYVSSVIASWAARYLDLSESREEKSSGTAPSVSKGQVLITEQDQKFTRRIYTENHQLVVDEPLSFGGADLGPNPYEHLLAGLGACTSMTIRMYANRKNLQLDNIEITLTHSRIHAEDCESCESEKGFVDRIEKEIKLDGGLSATEKNKLLEIADKCPVHKTLHNEILIESKLV